MIVRKHAQKAKRKKSKKRLTNVNLNDYKEDLITNYFKITNIWTCWILK